MCHFVHIRIHINLERPKTHKKCSISRKEVNNKAQQGAAYNIQILDTRITRSLSPALSIKGIQAKFKNERKRKNVRCKNET